MATLSVAASGERIGEVWPPDSEPTVPSLVVIIYIAAITVIPDSGDLLMPCTCPITGLLPGE
jgi:hypothetical protein